MQHTSLVKRAAIPTAPRRWHSIRVRPSLYVAVVLIVFLGVIGAAQTAGWWSTSGRTTGNGTPIRVTGADPAKIKGWMTISDVLSAYHVPKEVLYTRFAIPDTVPETAELKSIEDLAPTFSITDLRTWLAERSAGP